MDVLYVVLIGIAAGWIAGLLTKGKGFGLAGNLIVGILGAIFGGVLLPLLDMKPEGRVGQLVQATVGALVLLFLLGLASKQRRRNRRR